jgi:hypothetical protein
MPANSFSSKSNIYQLRIPALLSVLMSSATPVLAQLSVHVQTRVTNITSSNFTYGPVSTSPPTCDAASGGPGCKYVSFDFKGTCKTLEEDRHPGSGKCTITGNPTVLFSFSPSGSHDQNGNSTGVCAPFVESLVTTYEDGSTVNANGQGEVCCSDESTDNLCKGGFGPPFVTRESTIITGGSRRFKDVKGSGVETSAGYVDGSEIAQQEQVWVFPEPAHP